MSEYQAHLLERAKNILTSLPAGVEGRTYIQDNIVRVDLTSQRLGVFTLVLASEAPELVYDNRYVGFQTIPDGLDEVIEFARDAITEIADFILSEKPPVEQKSRVLGRTYVSIPRAYGPEWKLHKFN